MPRLRWFICVAAILLILPPVVGLSAQQAEPASLEGTRAGETREITLPKEVKLKLVWCPPGKFKMGEETNETNAVDVTLSKGFWLGQTEVTQGQWQGVMQTTPWKGEYYVQEGANYAASWVSWADATDYCRKLTESERAVGRLPADWEYALPSEAQWEYACRAGSTTNYSFGYDPSQLGDYAWFAMNALDVDQKYAHEVGQKRASDWSLHDMHGNVFEWCRDWHGDKLPGGTDPSGATTGSLRVYRGGSWYHTPGSCRSAERGGNTPDYRRNDLGFRVALVPAE